MSAASRESDADEFHDALDHLEEAEEEEEEFEHVAAADTDAVAVADDDEPSLLQIDPSEEKPPISITHPAVNEKGTEPSRPQPLTLTCEAEAEESRPVETQPSGDLLKISILSLFDALSVSGSEELENADTLGKISAEIDRIEAQSSDESHEKITQGNVQDEKANSESNSDGLPSENDDTATTNDAEEGEQEQTEKSLVEDGADDMQNHVPDVTESDVNEECQDASIIVSEEVDEGQVSNNIVSNEGEEEEEQIQIEAEGKGGDGVEEETTSTTLEVESSSFDTPTKELQALQLDEEKTIVDDSSEQLPEEAKPDEKESAAKREAENTAQEQVVTDGDYTTPRQIDCGELCDIGSPLEALFLFCQGSRSGLDIVTDEEGVEVPLRTSRFTDADPKVPAPLSPVEDRHHDYDSDSSDDSSIDSIGRFQMTNKDTGSIHDGRNVMKDINDKGSSDAIDSHYSILPDRETLAYHQRLSTGSNEVKQLATRSFDESVSTFSHRSVSGSPTASARKKASEFSEKLKRGVAGLKSSKNHHRKRILSSEELPGNAVYVRSSKAKTSQMRLASSSSEEAPTLNATDSSFNPLLLVKTIQAHDGPAWCAAFSKDGRFLATGGEDGNVFIWAVSPKSKTLHPKGVPSRGVEEQNKDHSDEEQVPPLTFIGLGPQLATNLEIMSSEPVQRYRDHTADVIDISWSENQLQLIALIDPFFCLKKFPHHPFLLH